MRKFVGRIKSEHPGAVATLTLPKLPRQIYLVNPVTGEIQNVTKRVRTTPRRHVHALVLGPSPFKKGGRS